MGLGLGCPSSHFKVRVPLYPHTRLSSGDPNMKGLKVLLGDVVHKQIKTPNAKHKKKNTLNLSGALAHKKIKQVLTSRNEVPVFCRLLQQKFGKLPRSSYMLIPQTANPEAEPMILNPKPQQVSASIRRGMAQSLKF